MRHHLKLSVPSGRADCLERQMDKDFGTGSAADECEVAEKMYTDAFESAASAMASLDCHEQVHWGSAEASLLVEALSNYQRLCGIDACGDTITYNAGRTLAKALTVCPSLAILVVSGCVIGESGAGNLVAQGVLHALALTHLHLDGCGICDAGLECKLIRPASEALPP